jgi:hypothetical protein
MVCLPHLAYLIWGWDLNPGRFGLAHSAQITPQQGEEQKIIYFGELCRVSGTGAEADARFDEEQVGPFLLRFINVSICSLRRSRLQ